MKLNILALKQRAAAVSKKAALATTGVLASASAFAVDRTTEIQAAGDIAKGNYVAVIGAVFAIAIVGFGFAALMGWLKR